MPTNGLHNVYYIARDMDRTMAFYRDVLELKLKFQDGDRWAQFDAIGANFSLSSPIETALGEGGAIAVFEVTDSEEMARRIAEGGGRVIECRDMGAHGKVVTFCDPEGNVLQMLERLKPSQRG